MIVEVWERLDREIVGAAELDMMQDAVAKRFGSELSPASIARVLADHGARLGHPEILQTDVRWRERQHIFTPDDLAFDTIESAFAFVEKLQQAQDPQSLRPSVVLIKSELEWLATSAGNKRAVAREVAQWLAVWLQNPAIFADWLALRRSTAEFQELFGTFPVSDANTQ
ncbi:MAG TPA: hypothetical protein VLB46_13295 [Pyrinomonadaceae bacterium]|nr:hypothetical protein [Pyrinomonadaceae bacterium]